MSLRYEFKTASVSGSPLTTTNTSSGDEAARTEVGTNGNASATATNRASHDRGSTCGNPSVERVIEPPSRMQVRLRDARNDNFHLWTVSPDVWPVLQTDRFQDRTACQYQVHSPAKATNPEMPIAAGTAGPGGMVTAQSTIDRPSATAMYPAARFTRAHTRGFSSARRVRMPMARFGLRRGS